MPFHFVLRVRVPLLREGDKKMNEKKALFVSFPDLPFAPPDHFSYLQAMSQIQDFHRGPHAAICCSADK